LLAWRSNEGYICEEIFCGLRRSAHRVFPLPLQERAVLSIAEEETVRAYLQTRSPSPQSSPVVTGEEVSERLSLALVLLVGITFLWSQPAYSQERIRIGISAVSLGFLPTVVGEKKGFYSNYGLVPEHVLVPCAIATNAILSDDLDYNVCTGPGIAGAIKGLPIKLVMTTQAKLGYLLLVKPNVQKLADLRGKTIGISTFGSQLYLTSTTLFRQSGMEPGKDVNLLPGGDNNARLAAMDAGKLDAAFVSSPSDIFGVKRGYKVLLWSRDHVPLIQNTIVVTDKKLKQSPDQVKRMLKGSIEALKFIREHQEESIAIASKWLKLDVATTRAAFENYLPCYSADGSLPDQALKDLIQYELDRSSLKKEIPLSQVASRDLLQQAQKELNLK
jgi:NitT/TauT family transport system substrate-binding protein